MTSHAENHRLSEARKVKSEMCSGRYLQIINFRSGLSNACLARHLQNT